MRKKFFINIIILFLILSIVFMFVGYIIYNTEEKMLINENKINLKNDLIDYGNIISKKTDKMIDDSQFLSSLVKQLFITSFNKPTSEDYNKIDLYSNSIITFCNNRNEYYGIKLIDIKGNEIINIHFYKNGYYSFLNKDRTYTNEEDFKKAILLKDGRVAFSNITDHNTINLYEPIFNYKNETIGLLVIEAFVNSIFSNPHEMNLYNYECVDADGNYIKSDIISGKVSNNVNIKEINPKLYKSIMLNKQAFFIEKDIFAFHKRINLYDSRISNSDRPYYIINYLSREYYASLNRLLAKKIIIDFIIAIFLAIIFATSWGIFRAKEHKYKRLLKTLAYRDHLTSIYNREFFMKELNEKIQNNIPYSLIYFDVDDFKFINDTYGHSCGDFVLKEIANRLLSVLRNGDMVARIGGDEFNVCINNITDKKIVENILERIKNKFLEPIVYNGEEIIVSFSMGISFFPDDAKSLNDILVKADTAMYYIKKHKKNGYQFYYMLDEKDKANTKLHLST